jgi:hypothetical protein
MAVDYPKEIARSAKPRFNFLAEQMPQQTVHFLNARSGLAGNGDQQIHRAAQLAAGFAGERRGENAVRFRLLHGSENIRAVPGCREGQRQIARASQRFDLAREDPVVAEIVAASGQRRGIGGERQSRQRAAVFRKADGQFGGEVLRVRRAAAIAEEEDLTGIRKARGSFLDKTL